MPIADDVSSMNCPARKTAARVVEELQRFGSTYAEARVVVTKSPFTTQTSKTYASVTKVGKSYSRDQSTVSTLAPAPTVTPKPASPPAVFTMADDLRPLFIPLLREVADLLARVLNPKSPLLNALRSAIGLLKYGSGTQ